MSNVLTSFVVHKDIRQWIYYFVYCLYSIKELSPLTEPVVQKIAEVHGKTPAQVLLRHLIQLGVAVIPKSVSPNRIKENFEVNYRLYTFNIILYNHSKVNQNKCNETL